MGEGAKKLWARLLKDFNLSKDEADKIHRHLGKSYGLEKDYMSWDELKRAAREVVSRIS